MQLIIILFNFGLEPALHVGLYLENYPCISRDEIKLFQMFSKPLWDLLFLFYDNSQNLMEQQLGCMSVLAFNTVVKRQGWWDPLPVPTVL